MKKYCLIFSMFPLFLFSPNLAKADMFGADVAVLAQILIQTIQQVETMTQILGSSRDTASILQEMNQGVKNVLVLADSAHVPLPAQAYQNANAINAATNLAQTLYGGVNSTTPQYAQTNYQSGVEGLYLSQDAFNYSQLLDQQGTQVEASAIQANQTAAIKLSAETLGVLVHATSQNNRLEAKQLEISSTTRIESTSKENAEFQSFIETQDAIRSDMQQNSFNGLNDGLGGI